MIHDDETRPVRVLRRRDGGRVDVGDQHGSGGPPRTRGRRGPHGTAADEEARALALQRVAGNRAAARLLARRGPRRAATLSAATPVQRAMKLELEVSSNKAFRNGPGGASRLPRKFGPKDYLVKGDSGVRLETDTRGKLEFETGWERRWKKLQAQVAEAVWMAVRMNFGRRLPSGRRLFPFDVPHLRTGTRAERRRGRWRRRPQGYEDNDERILGPSEQIEVDVADLEWKAGIQVSESFGLDQFESYQQQHEYDEYRIPATTKTDEVLSAVIPSGRQADYDGLRNMLLMIFNYVLRTRADNPGAKLPGGKRADYQHGVYIDISNLPAKQALALMSRTSFASVYRSLSSRERRAFQRIVRERLLLEAVGATTSTRVFVRGYGSKRPHRGPTIHAWLTGIPKGRDLMSSRFNRTLSSAMGRHDITRKGKHAGLVRFEARARRDTSGPVPAVEWVRFAWDQFLRARLARPRPNRKGQTGLELL